ncbi:MAG TPA: biotin--[acetyl-CoA-carboxylase] ligase [Candidatus Pacearchaeota archaeon]|nr:biotin--[acetyl-CoA-carboxylase] ligase [Candidatus Pacearchaeota archaeon]HPR79846.1 biotin--[acetyl-CoA-carboxylase] ligase [Candidatus Pacearchaeota archaeon]
MQIEKFKSISSTNKKAKEMSNLGVAPWTVVVSEVQENGYGRKGEAWYSPKGGLYFSIILPRGNIDDLQIITILAAFIVAKTIKESFNVEPLIKLPNDVLLNGKKICGILTENVIGSDVKLSVIGIGINTNIESFPLELKDIATSLKMELGKEVDNTELLEKIITELKNQFKIISE